MHALALFVIGLSGYGAFTKTREGADPARSIGEAMLMAVMVTVVISGGTLWLSGLATADVAEIALTVVALSFAAALSGALIAGLKPRREPVPHW